MNTKREKSNLIMFIPVILYIFTGCNAVEEDTAVETPVIGKDPPVIEFKYTDIETAQKFLTAKWLKIEECNLGGCHKMASEGKYDEIIDAETIRVSWDLDTGMREYKITKWEKSSTVFGDGVEISIETTADHLFSTSILFRFISNDTLYYGINGCYDCPSWTAVRVKKNDKTDKTP